VAGEGKGSRRTVSVNIEEGEFKVQDPKDLIKWETDITAKVIAPRTSTQVGDIILGSNLATSAYSTTLDGKPAWILENEHLRVWINRTGSSDNLVYYNTSWLVLAIYQKDLGEWYNSTLTQPLIEISVDEEPTSMVGNGYTYLNESSEEGLLGYGEVVAYLESTYGLNYYIHFVLESGADFLSIWARE
jgi:hypothetical protein